MDAQQARLQAINELTRGIRRALLRGDNYWADLEYFTFRFGNPLSEDALAMKADVKKLRHQMRRAAALGIPMPLYVELLRIVEPESLPQWLHTPNSGLQGQTPAQLLENGMERVIWEALDVNFRNLVGNPYRH